MEHAGGIQHEPFAHGAHDDIIQVSRQKVNEMLASALGSIASGV